MGIDARIETERGNCIADVPDPKSYVSWILGSVDLDATVCLRFIDPYGDTIFNRAQLDVVLSELETIKPKLEPRRLESAKKLYLDRAAAWPERATKEAHIYTSLVSIDDVRGHLDQLMSLVRHAIDQGPNHYVRFVSD
jgi:hypothetical protein